MGFPKKQLETPLTEIPTLLAPEELSEEPSGDQTSHFEREKKISRFVNQLETKSRDFLNTFLEKANDLHLDPYQVKKLKSDIQNRGSDYNYVAMLGITKALDALRKLNHISIENIRSFDEKEEKCLELYPDIIQTIARSIFGMTRQCIDDELESERFNKELLKKELIQESIKTLKNLEF